MDGIYEVLIQECILMNTPSYIIRPSINNRENGSHPLNIIEIVSDIKLRDKYNLSDGDEVIINI